MYLVFGTDLFLLNKQVKKIINQVDQDPTHYEISSYSYLEDDLKKVYQQMISLSFFVEHRIFMLKDCVFLTNSGSNLKKLENNDEEILKKMLTLNQDNITIIFTVQTNELSKKLKLAKLFESQTKVIEVKSLSDRELMEYVINRFQKANKEVNQEDLDFFLSKVPNDLVAINNEIQKLSSLEIKQLTSKEIVENMTKYSEINIFDLADAFLRNDQKIFIEKYHDYLLFNNDVMGLFYLLSNNLVFTRDCLLLKKHNKSEQEIANRLEAHPYRVKMTLKKHKEVNLHTLNVKILLLYDLNNSLVKGEINPEVISEVELIKIMETEK